MERFHVGSNDKTSIRHQWQDWWSIATLCLQRLVQETMEMDDYHYVIVTGSTTDTGGHFDDNHS